MRSAFALFAAIGLTACLCSAGCGAPTEQEQPDAGASSELDAELLLPDAGEPSVDGGAPTDAGAPDSGTAPDAGAVDAGPCAAWPDYDYAAPDCGPKPLRVQFDGDRAITDTGLDVYRLTWRFGDGQTSEATNPVHTYQQTGDYAASVSLTADVAGTDVTVNLTGIKVRVHAP